MYVVGGKNRATTEKIKSQENIITIPHLLPTEVDVIKTILTES